MASYWQKYGLSADPFVDEGLTYAPFFPSRWHQQLDLLRHLSHSSNMVLLVTGISGIGKTTFMEKLFEEIESKTGVCKVHGSQGVSPDVLQELIVRHIGMQAAGTPDTNFQQRFLLQIDRMHQAKDEFYLVIDNAHKLPKSSLALLLDLAEWQSGEAHPLHLILFGGPQLDAMMAEITAQHLGEAMTHTIRIEPFSLEMTKDYISHRLTEAGFQGEFPLSELQVNQIHQASNGVPAKINLIARQALLDNEMKNISRKSNAKSAKTSAAESKRKMNKSSFSLAKSALIGGLGVAGVLFFMVVHVPAVSSVELTANKAAETSIHELNTTSANNQSTQQTIDMSQNQVEGYNNGMPPQFTPQTENTSAGDGSSEAAAMPVESENAIQQTQTVEANTVSSAATENNASDSQTIATSVEGSSTWTPLDTTPENSAASDVPLSPSITAPSQAVSTPPAATTPAVAPSQTPVTEPAAPESPTQNSAVEPATPEPSPAKQNVSQQPTHATQTIALKPAVKKQVVSVQNALLSSDEQALMKANPSRVALQIAAANDYFNLKQFVKTMGLEGEVYFFKTSHAGKPWYVAVYGDYPNGDMAKRAIQDLPIDLLQREQVWPRSFQSIQAAIKIKS